MASGLAAEVITAVATGVAVDVSVTVTVGESAGRGERDTVAVGVTVAVAEGGTEVNMASGLIVGAPRGLGVAAGVSANAGEDARTTAAPSLN